MHLRWLAEQRRLADLERRWREAEKQALREIWASSNDDDETDADKNDPKAFGQNNPKKEVKAMTEGRHKISADDAVTSLNECVLQPLRVLADLLTNAEPAFLFADQRETLTAIGKLLSLLAEKADCILRDYSVEV